MKKSKMVLKGNYYYKYICVWNNETQQKKQIPIRLAHKDEYDVALNRKQIVERRARQLKQDGQLHRIIGYKFTWSSESGLEETAKPMPLLEGIDIYISKMSKLRSTSTINMNNNSFRHWIKFLTSNKSCSEIDTLNLMDYVVKHKGNRSDTSINMDLRILRTLLLYLRDVEKVVLDKNISFKRALKECPINDTEPIYITEVEFNEIMNEEWCRLYSHERNLYKEVFQLYWDIGVRLSEPFKGTIKGKYLHIPNYVAKNGVKRDVPLNNQQINLINRMRDKWILKGKSDNHIDGYSKMFKKALRHCKVDEEKHFHCLRHSYGIRRRLETNGNIIKIQEEMGHEDIKSTMKYQRCKPRKLKDDFPSFKEVCEALENEGKTTTSTINTSTIKAHVPHYDVRQIN